MKLWLLLMVIFACVGVVEALSRMFVFLAGRRVFCSRVFYIDGTDWERQQGAVNTFYQWSSHREGGVWIVADATGNPVAERSLKKLSQELGMIYCAAAEAREHHIT